ncbi:MAG: LacI family DNA-binding transcriptional regulator [Catenulispora sp.]|nr:LacI family DNA-binding transcriptional regulator [Catenulispora sp.]
MAVMGGAILSDGPFEAAARDDRPGGDPSRPVTIAYIAQSAGVSVPTVSKVLNGKSGVSAEKRALIKELISRHGYRKPTGANRRSMLELVFRDLESMWGVEVIRGVELAARRQGAGVLLSGFGPAETRGAAWDDSATPRPNCVVSVAQLSESERAELAEKGIPFVVFDPTSEVPDGVPFVGATNWSGGRVATRHLIELGHCRIAMIAAAPDVLCCTARLDGYRSALGAAGLPVDEQLVARAALTREAGTVAARALLDLADRPTAVFASNDLQALGVYQAARERGLRIPEDLSVVGFDDLPVVAWVDPPMTTVHQPLAEMAAAATELALALGRGEQVAQVGVELATKLTVRASTAPPKH